MSTATITNVNKIVGETAGVVWQALDTQGPLSLAKLAKKTQISRDVVMMAVGWLAREDKVLIEENSRGRVVTLIDRMEPAGY